MGLHVLYQLTRDTFCSLLLFYMYQNIDRMQRESIQTSWLSVFTIFKQAPVLYWLHTAPIGPLQQLGKRLGACSIWKRQRSASVVQRSGSMQYDLPVLRSAGVIEDFYTPCHCAAACC